MKVFSTMCGHGIIALTTVVFELNAFPISHLELKIDTPAGRIFAKPELLVVENRVVCKSVSFKNVASFVYMEDLSIEIDGLGTVLYDISYGGAFYAYVDVRNLNVTLDLTIENVGVLIKYGKILKQSIQNQIVINHPVSRDLSFLYGVIFVGDPIINKNMGEENFHYSRNVCVFANGEIDRSPTGTGVSGRVALEYKKGTLKEGEKLVVESIVDSIFTGQISSTLEYFDYKQAVIPEITGNAFILGRSEFWINPTDKIGSEGFIIR